MSVSLKQSYDIEYNGTANVSRMDLFVDTAADLLGLTTFDSITLLQGSTAKDISTGDEYMMQTGGTWLKQPSQSAFANVYTKAEIDSMLNLYYTKAEADALFEWITVTISTDTLPLTFIADGSPLISWSMKGNGQQQGTPTPDAPIMPEFVGVRTAQLFDKNSDLISCYINASGELLQTSSNSRTIIIECVPNAMYTIHVENNSAFRAGTFTNYPQYGDICDGLVDETTNPFITKNVTIATGNGTKYLCVFCYNSVTEATHWTEEEYFSHVMLNLGSTALPYEPFGYKIPISCGGETTLIYIGDPLRKALDGSDAIDVLYSSGTITRNVDADGNALSVPFEQSVDVPEIPIAIGENTLTIGTTLQPSEITITGKIREVT